MSTATQSSFKDFHFTSSWQVYGTKALGIAKLDSCDLNCVRHIVYDLLVMKAVFSII